MVSWTTACGNDANALGLRHDDGSWDDAALRAHVQKCPQCKDFAYRAQMPPFPDLLDRLRPLVPHANRTHVKLVCVACGGSSMWLEPRTVATPDRLVEIAEVHRREVHSNSGA